MNNRRSRTRLTALAVGLAVVMSSCGIQNQASESNDGPEAGKTKNSALGQWCEFGTGINIDIDAKWTPPYMSRRQLADYGGARLRWADNKTRITDVYGPSIVLCSSIIPINVAAAAGATSAAELPQAFVEYSTANQCISVENRKKTLRGYDEQIMVHSLDADKTIFEQMKTGRWVTTVQRPCEEAFEVNSLSSLSCVSVSHKAFEQAFYNEQYELHKEEAGTPYLDMIIIGKSKANALATC